MPLPVSLPGGYRPAAGSGGWGFAADGAAAWLTELLASGRTLHAWAGAHPRRRERTGRGRTWAVPAPAPGPTGAAGWVVRHYHRGGAVARWLLDRYVAGGEARPLAELSAAVEAARRGIATPAVAAGAVYPAGAFYRADLATEEIPGGVDLAEVLFGPGPDPAGSGPVALEVADSGAAGRLAALEAAGALVRRLAEAGVMHRDLNARNIVLQPGAGGLRGWVVDLDGCGFGAPSAASAAAMRRRLERSLRKLGARAACPLGRDAWSALDAGLAAPAGGP